MPKKDTASRGRRHALNRRGADPSVFCSYRDSDGRRATGTSDSAGGRRSANPSAAPQPEHVPASVSALPTPPPSTTTAANDAPRTLRLRPETAQKLRAAWLEAKRDDVLLTAQDFASNLVEDALRRRRRTANSS